MSDNWNLIKNEVSAYRNYVKNLPESAKESAKYSYLLTSEEIDRLLALKGTGDLLDGVRIYLGSNEIAGCLVPTVHIVAVEKDGGIYNDYNVPKEMPADEPMVFGATPDAGSGSTGNAVPCPAICGGTNILNS